MQEVRQLGYVLFSRSGHVWMVIPYIVAFQPTYQGEYLDLLYEIRYQKAFQKWVYFLYTIHNHCHFVWLLVYLTSFSVLRIGCWMNTIMVTTKYTQRLILLQNNIIETEQSKSPVTTAPVIMTLTLTVNHELSKMKDGQVSYKMTLVSSNILIFQNCTRQWKISL